MDTAARHQVISGWEATAQAGHEYAAYPRFRDALLARAAGLGLTRLRLEVRSGVEHTRDHWSEGRAGRLTGDAYRCARYETLNDDADPRTIRADGFRFSELDHTVASLVLPLRDTLAARGTRLSLTVTYVSFLRQCPRGRRFDHRDPAEYAEFVLATSLHLRERFGIEPDRWEVILEPDNTDDWDGRRIGEAIVAAAARVREHGFTFRFVAPSSTSMRGALRAYDALVQVPGARAELAEFAYHRYRGVSSRTLRAIAARSARDGVPAAMLEHIGSGVDDLLEDLTVGNVTAWQQYAVAYPSGRDRGGLYFPLRGDTADPVVTEGRRTRLLRPVFASVRPGAVRIGTRPVGRGLAGAAFRNADGRLAAVARARCPARIAFAGLPAGRYAVRWVTDADEGAMPDTTIAAGDTVVVPLGAPGVVTVVSR